MMMQEDIKMEIRTSIDYTLEAIHFRNMKSLNEVNFASDSKKLAQLESLILQSEKYIQRLEQINKSMGEMENECRKGNFRDN